MATRIPAKPLTKEERITECLAKARGLRDSANSPFLAEPPPHRRFDIGTSVEIGHLRNASVIGYSDDLLYVACEYDDIENKYGKEIDHGRAINAFPWTSVFPVVTEESNFARESLIGSYSNTDLESVVNRVLFRETDDSPEYQRGYVWSDDDKTRLIDSIFHSRDIGKFVFIKNPYPEPQEILDGKQRLKAISEFFQSRYPYKGKFFDQMSRMDRDRFLNRNVQYTEIDSRSLTRKDKLELFLELNSGGVPQTEEHLSHVRELLSEETGERKISKARKP